MLCRAADQQITLRVRCAVLVREAAMNLDPALLERIRERAAGFDRDNRFFDADLEELRAAGYLRPRPLLETIRDQRLLAAHAPATALGLNMHHVWMGLAQVLSARGDDSLDWVLRDGEAGELFAFGISEPGNDEVLWDSTTSVERVDGGFAFSGTKVFTSLAPAWTRLGVFGRWESPDGPRLVHGVLDRSGVADGSIEILDDWDTLGMRATQSRTTRLHGAVVPDARVTRILPVGPNPDPFVFGIFACFLLGIGSVYAGVADRALQLAVGSAQSRVSRASGLPVADDPQVRWALADAALAIDALAPDLESLAADVDGLADRGASWFRALTGAKYRAVETARTVVDASVRVAGGSGYRSSAELSRLQRDVLAGVFHPSDAASVHRTVAANLLG